MSRHTLDDGITPDLKITKDKYHTHLPSLAPSLKLLGDYYKRNLEWELFQISFIKELADNPKKVFLLNRLANLALINNIALLCKEITPEKCNRRLLAMECKQKCPNLEIIIR